MAAPELTEALITAAMAPSELLALGVGMTGQEVATTDASESEYFQFYIETVPLDRADWLTQQINGTLKAISEANGTIVDHNIDIVGTSHLVARIVYTLPKGTTLAFEVSR
jgi:hypothetical protein